MAFKYVLIKSDLFHKCTNALESFVVFFKVVLCLFFNPKLVILLVQPQQIIKWVAWDIIEKK